MEMRQIELTEEQRAIGQMCREFVDEVVIPFVRDNRDREWLAAPEDRIPWELVEAADQLGLRTLGVPDRYGGMAVDALTFALIAEELARGDLGLADMLGQVWKVSVLLSHCAPEHLQEVWFPRIVEDPRFVLAHALTEPRGASDRWLPYNVPEANMDTKARLEDGHWVLNGRKQFISNGYDAKLYVIYANTDPRAGIQDGTSSFLVPRGTPGFTVGRAHEKTGGRFMNNAELILEDCRIPEDHLLVKDEALKKAGVYFQPGKIIQAAKAVGVGAAALEQTAAYVQERVQGGRPLIQHQVVAAHLADMATQVETARALARYAARALEAGAHDAGRLCLMAKLYTSETIFQVCKTAVELHGGTGIMREAGVEKLFRDASILLHMDGTNDLHRFKIVKAMFPDTAGRYADPEAGDGDLRATPAPHVTPA